MNHILVNQITALSVLNGNFKSHLKKYTISPNPSPISFKQFYSENTDSGVHTQK